MKIIRFESRTNAHKEDETSEFKTPNRFKILWMNVNDLEYHGILLARQYDREKKQRIVKLRRQRHHKNQMEPSTPVQKDLSWVYDAVPIGVKPSQEVEPLSQVNLQCYRLTSKANGRETTQRKIESSFLKYIEHPNFSKELGVV